MLKTVKDIAHLNFRAIKIHILYILKGTTLAKIYEGKPFEIISREKYIETVVKQLELIKARIIVKRLMGDPMKSDLIVPS